MQTLIGNGKYKVIEVLYSDSDLNVYLCSEITLSSSETVIINSFKSRTIIRSLLPMFYDMKNESLPRDFQELMIADGCISAIFRFHDGVAFNEYFKGGTNLKFKRHMEFADSLLSSALEFDLLDDRIAASVLCEKNVVIDSFENKASFNYIMRPDAAAVSEFCSKRLGGILKMIFPPDRYLPEEIERLIGELLEGKYRCCAAVYSRWREISESALKTHEEHLKESHAKYLIRKIKSKKGKASKNPKSKWRRT